MVPGRMEKSHDVAAPGSVPACNLRCHPDRSAAKWRDLLFLRLTSEQMLKLTATNFRLNALESKDMLSDLEYSYSPVRDKVRDLREYL